MKKVVKWIFSMVFSLGLFAIANAQTDSVGAPAEDAIVCKQIAENVFDCYVQEGNTNQEMYDNELDNQDQIKGRRNNDGNTSPQDSNDVNWNNSGNNKEDNNGFNTERRAGRNNPDPVHMYGSSSYAINKMYEYNPDKKGFGDPDNTDMMYNEYEISGVRMVDKIE